LTSPEFSAGKNRKIILSISRIRESILERLKDPGDYKTVIM
jgi:hypothetical protein